MTFLRPTRSSVCVTAGGRFVRKITFYALAPITAGLVVVLCGMSIATAAAARSGSTFHVNLAAATGSGQDPTGSDWDAWTAKYHRAPNEGMYFHAWGTEPALPYSSDLAALVARGITPNVAWSPGPAYTMRAIAAGTYDSYINSQAALVKAWPHPVQIRLFHEFNSPSQPFGPGKAKDIDFLAAYKHVIDVFRADGVTNVMWVWSADFWIPGGYNKDPTPRYPGNSYVGAIGWDGYSTQGYTASLDQVLAPNYNTLTALTGGVYRPFQISESGTSVPSQKNTWYSNAILSGGGGLLARYPRLTQFAAFDRVSDADYTIDGSGAYPAADTAFTKIISGAPF